VSGPPMHQRFVRYDDARVADLKILQERILSYWHIKKALPDDITAVDNASRASRLPKDPSTGTLYEYYTVQRSQFLFVREFPDEIAHRQHMGRRLRIRLELGTRLGSQLLPA